MTSGYLIFPTIPESPPLKNAPCFGALSRPEDINLPLTETSGLLPVIGITNKRGAYPEGVDHEN